MLQIQSGLRSLFQTARRLAPSPSRRLLPAQAGLVPFLCSPRRATLGATWSSAAAALPPWTHVKQQKAAMLPEAAATPPSGKPAALRASRSQFEAAEAAAAIDGTSFAVVDAAAAEIVVIADGAGNQAASAAALELQQQQQEQPPAPAATPPPRKKSARPPAKSPSQLVLADQAALQFKAQRIAELLGRLYPDPPIPLDHSSTFQLLCAVLLSAQVRANRHGADVGAAPPWSWTCRARFWGVDRRGPLPALKPPCGGCRMWLRPGCAGKGLPCACTRSPAALALPDAPTPVPTHHQTHILLPFRTDHRQEGE